MTASVEETSWTRAQKIVSIASRAGPNEKKTMSKAFICFHAALLMVILATVTQADTPSQDHQSVAVPQGGRDTRGTAASPIVVELRPTPESKEQSEQSKKDREAKIASDREASIANRRLVVIGGAQLAVFLLQLLVFGYQAVKLRETVKASAEQAQDVKRSIAEAARTASAIEGISRSMEDSARSVTGAVELQRRQMEEQQDRATRQDFEGTFFQLLHRFSEVVADMRFEYDILDPDPITRVPRKPAVAEGRNAMRVMFIAFKKYYEGNPQQIGIPLETYYGELYRDFYNAQQHELGIYFRTLYHIFKFIDTSMLSPGSKAEYASIARAQLSAYELAMIFYNGLWDEGRDGFKPLIEKYGILKHLRKEIVLREHDLHDRALYAETAFLNYRRRLLIWNNVEPVIDYD